MQLGGLRSAALPKATDRHHAAGHDRATNRNGTADRKDATRRGPHWWRRIRRQFLPPPEAILDQLNRQLMVLEGARTELEAGWIQGGWWAAGSANGDRRLVTGLEAGPAAGPAAGLEAGLEAGSAAAGGRPARVDGVCLVGALVRAGTGAAGGDEENPGTGRAVDAVYEALWASQSQETATPPAELSGRLPPEPLLPLEPLLSPEPLLPPESPLPPAPSLPPVPPPAVRLARVRTITQWNDRPGRTRAEVLTVVDRAISATIMTLIATQPPKAPPPKAPPPKAPPPKPPAPHQTR